MRNRGKNVQVCDATKDDSSNAADPQNKILQLYGGLEFYSSQLEAHGL